jgi:hypothetical protein
MFKGIIETDNWFGPLFNNVRIIKTDIPIDPETKRGRYAVSAFAGTAIAARQSARANFFFMAGAYRLAGVEAALPPRFCDRFIALRASRATTVT